MNTKSGIFLMVSIVTIFAIMMVPSNISAHTSQNSITITPINEKVSLQQTITTMSIPQDNILPWGTVTGTASDYVERYPVIIQFFKGEDPVHFTQVDVKGDGSYEYKFRVKSFDPDTGRVVNVFEGDYTVKIFRVIPNTNDQA